MEREYYHSIDSLKLIAVVCFCIFAFGYFEYFGSVIKYTLTFALPLLYMIFGFLLLGENEERTDIILRSLFRNLAVLGIAFIFLGIASFIYMKITGITIVITLDSFINQFVFGKWQLPVGSFVWFTEELVVLFDDETRELAREIVRCGADRFYISLDYFDASINRIAAWVNGFRNFQKALLFAFLQPVKTLKALQDKQDFTKLQVLQEELKLYPFGEVWAEYCRKAGVKGDETWLDDVLDYERKVLAKRV